MVGAARRRLSTWLRPSESLVSEDDDRAGEAGEASMVGAARRRLSTWLRPIKGSAV